MSDRRGQMSYETMLWPENRSNCPNRTYLIQVDPKYDSFSSVRVQTRRLDGLVVDPEVRGGHQQPLGAVWWLLHLH